MKDLGRSVHSVDVVKKKSSSGCLIIKRKVADGDGGVLGFSDSSSSRKLFKNIKDTKRPRLIRSYSESSDEFTEPYDKKLDRSRNRLAVNNGVFMSNRGVTNAREFDEYDEFHERRIRKDVYDYNHRLSSHWHDGDRMVSGGGSSNRRIYDSQREFVHDSINTILDAKSNRFNHGNGNRYKMEDDELHVPHSGPSGKYQQVSDAPIRLQGKNGVLKVMVKKHKPISVPFQDYDSVQPEERKESRPVLYKKKQLNVSHKSHNHWEVSNKNKAVMESLMYPPGSVKSVFFKSQEKSDSDTLLPVKSSSVLHSSNEKLDKREKKLSPQTKSVAPIKGKETKVKRGSGTEKQLLREKIRSMLLCAGWTIDYRPRRNRDYLDAVYINPSGTAYWSIIKAYEALQKEGKDHSEVGGEFTPLPVETLSKLTRQTRKKIEREMKKKRNDEGKSSETSKRRLTEASQDSGDDSNDNDYMETAKKRNFGIDSHVVQGQRSNKLSRCTLLIRSSGKKSENDRFVPYSGKRTVLSWLIDSGTVQMREKVQYMNRKKTRVMQEGWITKEGIHCGCCSKILTVLKFELHAGSKLRQPYLNIFVQSGNSLIQCLIDAWNRQGELERKGFYAVDVVGDDPNDDTCGLCGDGGDLICCDGCPSTFHQSCLGIQMLPQGDWHCPKCSCKYCELATEGGVKTERALLACCVCEKKYHESCSLEIDGNPSDPTDPNLSFCGDKCLQLYNNLQKLVGVKHELDSGFSWGLIHRSDVALSPETCSSTEISHKVECNSKLAVALSVIDECFLPVVDRRSGVNLIHNVVYNCGSNFSRLNYCGFFTAILERSDEIVCAASIRIHGTQLAEMPFIGTRHIYRRQGMCRRLLSAIESALASLHIEKLIIPAIAEHMHTWTDVFGFKPLEESHKNELRSMNMLVFPGTDMLQKSLDKTNIEMKKSESISLKKELSEKMAPVDSDSHYPPCVSLDDSISGKNVHSDSTEANDVVQDVKMTIDKTSDADVIPPQDPDFVLQDNTLVSKESDSVDVKSDSRVEECVSNKPGLLAGMESVSASTDSDSIINLTV